MGNDGQPSLFNQSADDSPARCLGITVSGSDVVCVLLDLSNGLPAELLLDETFNLAQGDRPQSYQDMFQRVRDFIQDKNIQNVAIKDSAPPRSSVQKAHLQSAELRGVVKAAASAASADISVKTKSAMSRYYGERKTDEYVQSDDFWDDAIDGDMRKGSRETALLIFYSFE